LGLHGMDGKFGGFFGVDFDGLKFEFEFLKIFF
jgi:hypothetical protein